MIYDAAISPEAWVKALDATAAVANATGATLFAVDGNGLPFHAQYVNSAYTEEDVKEYFERIAKYEEAGWKTLTRSPSKRLIMDDVTWSDLHNICNREDMLWYRERRMYRRAGAKLNSDSGWDDCLGLQYPDTMRFVPRLVIRRTEELLPHLAKVVQMHRTFCILKHRFNAILQAIDHIRIGVFILSPSGQLIIRNREADRIIDQSDGISVTREKLICCLNSDTTRALRAATTLVANTCNGQANTPEQFLCAERSSGAHPYLIEISPLSDSESELQKNLRGVILYIIDPDNLRTLDIPRVSKYFGLTVAETAICRYLVDGKAVVEIAELRNVSIETIKSQIKSINRKLNVHRRADLIRKILAITPPIV